MDFVTFFFTDAYKPFIKRVLREVRGSKLLQGSHGHFAAVIPVDQVTGFTDACDKEGVEYTRYERFPQAFSLQKGELRMISWHTPLGKYLGIQKVVRRGGPRRPRDED